MHDEEDEAQETVWDVIVVGAGPGGATAAWKAAEGGLRVLLLERAPSLPRYKPCGGGIPSSVSRHVSGLDPFEFSDLTITHLRHSWKGKDPILAPMTTRDGSPAVIWMVQRPRFDRYLVRRAEQAGARLLTGVKVGGVRVDAADDSVTVSGTTPNGAAIWRARHVVGADGARGVVGASVGLRLGKRFGIAREVEIPFEGGADNGRWHPRLAPNAAYLDYGTVPHGYAWIFPKQGCLSVGAGLLLPPRDAGDPSVNRGNGELLRRAMDNLLVSVGLPPLPPDGTPGAARIWAHPIPYWTGAEPLQTPGRRGHILLVGDAAGVVQPMFGEGIQYALRTGDLAARCILDGTAPAYTDRVRDQFASEFDAAARVGRAFHRAPFLSYHWGVKNPRGTHLVGRLVAGEASLADLEQRVYKRLRFRHPSR